MRPVVSKKFRSLKLLACLPIDSTYRLHLHYTQLISFCVLEEENSVAVYSEDMDITFIFPTQKDKSKMVTCKLCTNPCTD